MDDLLNAFKNRKPEIVFEWSDAETGAEGWVVINSLRGGAAGGGTRMRKGLDRREVESLAKIMEIKFTISGPPIGGAKSGINFDPNDPRKELVLHKWYKAVTPLLKHYYGTGGDLNIDEVKEVIPITEDYGLWHPQEGIVNGFYNPRENEKIHLIGQLRLGVSKPIEDSLFSPDTTRKYTVSDMITGFGVAESVKHYYNIYKNSTIEGKQVIVQGWGNVAGAAAFYLSQYGAKIVAILDREAGMIRENGLEHEEVKQLFNNRIHNKLTGDHLIPYHEIAEGIWDIPADIFIPAAASRLVSKAQIERLMANNLEVISCGANVPFIDDDIFFGSTAHYADEVTSLIPDFIANCGMARTFAYLMQGEVEVSDEAIFGDVSETIRRAIQLTHQTHKADRRITQTALQVALKEIVLAEKETGYSIS